MFRWADIRLISNEISKKKVGYVYVRRMRTVKICIFEILKILNDSPPAGVVPGRPHVRGLLPLLLLLQQYWVGSGLRQQLPHCTLLHDAHS